MKDKLLALIVFPPIGLLALLLILSIPYTLYQHYHKDDFQNAKDSNLSITCNDLTTFRKVITSEDYRVVGNFIEHDKLINHLYSVDDCEVNYVSN